MANDKKPKAFIKVETPDELMREFDTLIKSMDVFMRMKAVDAAVRAGAKPVKAAVMRHVPKGKPENRQLQSAKVRDQFKASRPLHTTIGTVVRRGNYGALAMVGADFYTGRHANLFASDHESWKTWGNKYKDTKIVRQFMKLAQDESMDAAMNAVRTSLVKSLEEFARG